jgi:hypothetical protein
MRNHETLAHNDDPVLRFSCEAKVKKKVENVEPVSQDLIRSE